MLQEIINGCKQNNHASQRELYQCCFVQMMRVCLRYHKNKDDAAASYNTAMFTVFIKINQFENKGEFFGWVRKIVIRTCLNEIKKTAKFDTKEFSDNHADVIVMSPEVYSHLESKEILELVNALPKNTGLVFNLFVMENFTHTQIAEELRISVGTSKWHLNNARTILKQQINLMHYNEHAKY